jgi:hypothetical protein
METSLTHALDLVISSLGISPLITIPALIGLSMVMSAVPRYLAYRRRPVKKSQEQGKTSQAVSSDNGTRRRPRRY